LTQPEPPPVAPPLELAVGDVAARPLTQDVVGDARPQLVTEPRRLWVQELVRASYALILVVIFGITVWAAFIGANSANWPNFKELLQVLLPAETALLGSAAGFYFGSRQRD
jgi:hypothetical protein